MSEEENSILTATKSWVNRFVIGLDICPFAKHVPAAQIRYTIFDQEDLLAILENIQSEFQFLLTHKDVETSLIIYPNGIKDFELFLDVFYACEMFMEDQGLEEDFQLVAFHPQFMYNESNPDDPANYTNRSSYPMIHILRVDSVSKAIENHPAIESIPQVNMEKLRKQSKDYWEKFRVDSI